MITHEAILDRVAEEIGTLFPPIGAEGRIYRNQTPTQFVRPAAMIRLTEERMRCMTALTVAREMAVEIALFCPVDEYHNSDVVVLGAMQDVVMEHFSGTCMDVGNRALDIGEVTGEVGADYALVRVQFTWQDSRRHAAETTARMEQLGMQIERMMKEE